jgi:hypothetical protein
MLISLNPADVANAQLGVNLPLLYGYVRGRGNEILNHTLSNKNRIVIRIAGDGECDGIETLFINANRVNHADTTLVHFHPGIDGELGHGLTPDSNGGDQRVDNFWSQLPANFVPTTFSRKCYLMFNVPPDPAAPSATLDIIFDLRGCKVRQFDAAGNQTAYSFSTNGAWQCLDAILRSILKPEWNPGAAAAGGGDLTADEKARIDFPSVVDAAAWCDQVLANGQKRFESSLAITQATSLLDVLTQLQIMSQIFVIEDSSKIYIRADKPRASTFILTSGHVVPGKAEFDKISLHGAKNRLIAAYNDLNAQDMADLDTAPNLGLWRSGTGTVTGVCKTNHPFQAGQYVQVCPPTDGSTHDTAYDGVFLITALPAANQFNYSQSGNANWLQYSEQLDNDVWQKQTNISVVANNQTDPLGGNTADTITSGVTAGQAVFQQSLLQSQNGVSFTFSVWLKAAANLTVTLQMNRGGGVDNETSNANVTTAWQRFSFTHSGTWTGSGRVIVFIIMPINSSVFAWGTQLEDGSTATAYRQTVGINELLWTENFGNAVWAHSGGTITVTPDSTTDPLGGNTADTLALGVTAPGSVLQAGAMLAGSGVRWTFSVWLKANVNTSVTLSVSRTGGDVESTTITVTNAWQRFSLTHSATWTVANAVTATIQLNTASSSIFAWGAQLEVGPTVNAYISTTGKLNIAGALSGNGYAGTPESRFAVRAPVVDHEQHQKAIGQRGINLTPTFRVVPLSLNLGNNTDERVRRILNFLKTRNLGVDQSPYIAPWDGKILCYLDAVDLSQAGNPRALISQLCGDIITVDASVSEEYQGDYEIFNKVYSLPAIDGSFNNSGPQIEPATIELTVLQYISAAFSDTSQAAQAVKASITSGLVPISAVDSNGVQRLSSSLRNNPLNVNAILTGANPLTQVGSTTNIAVASCTFQFGFGQKSYNSGSVNPGGFGKYAVYCKDPNFTGGSVTFFATQSMHDLTADDGIIVFGTITTSNTGGGTGNGWGAGLGDGGTDVLPSR